MRTQFLFEFFVTLGWCCVGMRIVGGMSMGGGIALGGMLTMADNMTVGDGMATVGSLVVSASFILELTKWQNDKMMEGYCMSTWKQKRIGTNVHVEPQHN